MNSKTSKLRDAVVLALIASAGTAATASVVHLECDTSPIANCGRREMCSEDVVYATPRWRCQRE